MMLKINSWEELKDQLGGMYGVSFDKLFKDVQDEEFDMSVAVDKIADIVYDEDYFKMPEQVAFEDADDLIDNITNVEIKFFEHGGKSYRIRPNGVISNVKGSHDPFGLGKAEPRNGWTKVDADEFFTTSRFYKFVKPINDKLASYYDASFRYIVGEEVVAKNKYYPLFFNEWNRISESTYCDKSDKVLIEVEIKAEDFKGIMNAEHITASKCKVIRIVPKEEYAGQLK